MARPPWPWPSSSSLLLLLAVSLQLAARAGSSREPIRCPPRMHQCVSLKQVKCFLPDAVCDGEPDCEDGSDEAGCTACKPGSLLCEGRCARRCDGVVECADERDEEPCPHCRGGAVLCSGRCLRQCRDPDDTGCVWRCDGVVECADGGDEARCHRCADARGVEDLTCGRRPAPRVLGVPRPYHNVTCGRRCDGHRQCANGWDEMGCALLPAAAGPAGPAWAYRT